MWQETCFVKLYMKIVLLYLSKTYNRVEWVPQTFLGGPICFPVNFLWAKMLN